MTPGVPDEQKLYARWLQAGARTGLALLVAGFLAYVLGLLEPHVPLARLSSLWSQPVERYREITGAPAGWEWLGLLHYGDYLNFIGIAILGLVSTVCYARIVPELFKRGQRVQGWLAIAQVLVLLAAASGLLVGGH